MQHILGLPCVLCWQWAPAQTKPSTSFTLQLPLTRKGLLGQNCTDHRWALAIFGLLALDLVPTGLTCSSMQALGRYQKSLIGTETNETSFER